MNTQPTPDLHATGNDSLPELIRMNAVVKWTGLCRSTIYRMIEKRSFPQAVQLSKRNIAWRKSDLVRWSAELRLRQESRNSSH